MSKLVAHSRTFLPMVIKKSTPIERLNILETSPTASSKLDLPSNMEAPEKNIPTEKEDHNEETLMLLRDNLVHSKQLTDKILQERTLFQALVMDVMQVQGWLAKVLARGHMRMFRQEPGLLRGLAQGPSSSSTLVFLEGRLRVKEEVPNSILPEHSKTKPIKKRQPENVKKEEVKSVNKNETKSSSIRSNFVDSLLERATEWQQSISANLGAMQKKVVDKLPK